MDVGVEPDGAMEVPADVHRTYGKDALPIAELFTRDGPPRLTLITCGGAFDVSSGSYADNVVVHAVPTDTVTTDG